MGKRRSIRRPSRQLTEARNVRRMVESPRSGSISQSQSSKQKLQSRGQQGDPPHHGECERRAKGDHQVPDPDAGNATVIPV